MQILTGMRIVPQNPLQGIQTKRYCHKNSFSKGKRERKSGRNEVQGKGKREETRKRIRENFTVILSIPNRFFKIIVTSGKWKLK